MRAVGGWVKRTYETERPPRTQVLKISPPKSSGFVFPEPHPPRPANPRKPLPPYAALRAARQEFSENDASFIRARLYDQVRTYFQSN